MKRNKKDRIVMALGISALSALLSGCGGAPSQVPIPPPTVGGAGAMPAGCVPLNNPTGIGFNATGILFNETTVRAGAIPSVDPYPFAANTQNGTVMVMPGGPTGPYSAPNSELTITPDGSISMNITPTGIVPGSVYPTANATGTITLSQDKLQRTMSLYGINTMNYMPPGMTPGVTPGVALPMAPANLCVTGVAFNLGRHGLNLFGPKGRVYLYLYNATPLPQTYLNPIGVTPTGVRGIYLEF